PAAKPVTITVKEDATPVSVDSIQEKTIEAEPAKVAVPTSINQTVKLQVETDTVTAKPANGKKFMFDAVADAQSCGSCGGMMTRNGSCYLCRDCGATSGCS